jgi:hypothetical protein
MRVTLALALVIAAGVVPFATAAVKAPSAGSVGAHTVRAAAWYTTTGGIEQALEQNGVFGHRTLYAGCVGQGYPGRNMIDPKFGFPDKSYSKFLCIVTLSGSSISEISVWTVAGNRYRYQKVF